MLTPAFSFQLNLDIQRADSDRVEPNEHPGKQSTQTQPAQPEECSLPPQGLALGSLQPVLEGHARPVYQDPGHEDGDCESAEDVRHLQGLAGTQNDGTQSGSELGGLSCCAGHCCPDSQPANARRVRARGA